MVKKPVKEEPKTVMSAVGIYRLYDEYSVMLDAILRNHPIDDMNRFYKRFEYVDTLLHHFQVMDGVASLPNDSNRIYVCKSFEPFQNDNIVSQMMERKIHHEYPNDNVADIISTGLFADGDFNNEQWKEMNVGPSSHLYIAENLMGTRFADSMYSLKNIVSDEEINFLAGTDRVDTSFKLFCKLERDTFSKLCSKLNHGILDKLGYEPLTLGLDASALDASQTKWYQDTLKNKEVLEFDNSVETKVCGSLSR